MKKLVVKFRHLYKEHDYFYRKKSEYTALLLAVLSVYGLVTCALFWPSIATSYIFYVVIGLIVTSTVALLCKRLELSQNMLLVMLMALAMYHYPQVERFHFYAELIIIIFVTVIIYVKRYQYIGVLIGIFIGFYGRYQMSRSYLFLLDYDQMQSSQHIFIMMTLFMLILLSFYVDKIVHRGIDENKLLEESVHIDLLTQLYTRTKFNEDVQAISKGNDPVFKEIGILDIDKFKDINDTYGHYIGDMILERLAYEMKIFFPEPLHRVYRWGGEEFIVLSAETTADKFDKRLDTFRQYVDEAIVVNDLNVTISIGTTSIKEEMIKEESFKTTFCTADNALYKAKASGRNVLVRGDKSSECYEMGATENI